MLKQSNDIRSTLEKHGTKVINAVGAMVSALKTEDDAKLLAKISEVVFNLLRIIIIRIILCFSYY